MEISNIINSAGLVIDIIGVVLIFFFGISPMIDSEGSVFITLEQRDELEIRKAKKYKCISRFGLILIALGFIAQIISNTL